MKYSDLCQAFYIKRGSSGLKGKTSQHDIGEFFMLSGIDKAKYEDYLPTSDDAYAKWFSGLTEGPKPEIWEAVSKINESTYASMLEKAFDKKNIDAVAVKLGIRLRTGESLDHSRLAWCITKLMISMAENGGESEKEPKEYYGGTASTSKFAHYKAYAEERYNLMKLIGGEEVQLRDYFVCNSIGERIKVGVDRSKIKTGYIDNATIEKIRNFYSKRGYDNRKVLLLASGGSGKTLMLQHLLLESMSRFNDTGILPVFLELRYYVQSSSILKFITDTLNTGGGSFTEDDVSELLKEAKLHLLFDGLDEIDPSDIGNFHRAMGGFASEYSNVMIIIASREGSAKLGLNGFMPMYVWPFDNDQSLDLIDNILKKSGNQKDRAGIIEYIDHGFIKKDGIFASHPMMLTFVARNYHKFDKNDDSHIGFYRSAYEALLSGHDDNKKPYDRIFMSVDNAEQFTEVFSEFCARSYERGQHEFDDESFDALFKELVSYKGFENTHKMNKKNFQHDACSTACMMYEEDPKILYIDPGFQKYMFAHYYINAKDEETKEMGKELNRTDRHAFDDYEAFDMLYSKVQKKFEVCVIFPYLKNIFQGNDDKEAFVKYLEYGYDEILYTVIHEDEVASKAGEDSSGYDLGVEDLNEARTVLLDYIFNIIHRPHTVVFTTTDTSAEVKEANYSQVYGRYEEDAGRKRLYLSKLLADQLSGEMAGGITYDYVTDRKGVPVALGGSYRVNTLDLAEDVQMYDDLLNVMMGDDQEESFWSDFQGVKAYYNQLRKQMRQERVY